MLDGNVERYELIDEPRRVEYSFVLGNDDDLIVLSVFRTEFHHDLIRGVNRLIHVVKTQVAGDVYHACGMETQSEEVRHLGDRHLRMELPTLYIAGTDSLEEAIVKAVFKRRDALFQPLQIYLKGIYTTHRAAKLQLFSDIQKI